MNAQWTDGVPGAQAGVYHVQFLVDGSWMTSPEFPVGQDEDGHLCNTARTKPGSVTSATSVNQVMHCTGAHAAFSADI